MECEIVIEKRRVRADEALFLDYTLSKRSVQNGLVLYSLLIAETHGERSEFVFLDALTDDEKQARELFFLFAEETVTPCTVEDVLNEIFYAP